MVALNTRLREHLARNWREDLQPDWQRFFEGIEPDLDGLPNWEVQDLFPNRLSPVPPRENVTHHMLRAFDGLTPDRVRVVIIGQDPYPRRTRATGRAFEDGELNEDAPEATAESLQRLLQSAAALQYPDLGIPEDRYDWPMVCDAIGDGRLKAPATPGFFDALAEQGVLSVNTAWTFTSMDKTHLRVHIAVWMRAVEHLILRLVEIRSEEPLVFLILGTKARTRFRMATRRYMRANRGHHIETVYCAHPMAWTGRTYIQYENPLRRVNDALVRLGADLIRWWPARVEQELRPDP